MTSAITDTEVPFSHPETRPLSRIATARTYLRSDLGRKALRFAAVSGVAIVTSIAVLVFCYGILRWNGDRATRSQLTSFVISTLVSYLLNRLWVWERNGRSRLATEIVPFWALAVAQLAISIAYIRYAQRFVESATANHTLRTMGFIANNLFVYGVMWVGKFLLLNKVFATKPGTSDGSRRLVPKTTEPSPQIDVSLDTVHDARHASDLRAPTIQTNESVRALQSTL